MAKHYSIAIDGPAGAGKSTIAKRLAQELGYHYVDTGAIYRTLGYFFDLVGIGPKDIDGITRLIDECVIEIEWDDDGSQHMFLNEIDVSEDIRTPDPTRRLCRITKILLLTQRIYFKHDSIRCKRQILTLYIHCINKIENLVKSLAFTRI